MLVLTRKTGEGIVIGSGIRVTVLRVGDNRVKLGLTGPAEVPIYRGEVQDRIADRESSPDS